MAEMRREQYIIVDDFWRFRVSDDGNTISMDTVSDEQDDR